MNEPFKIDHRLSENSAVIAELKLSRVLLANKENFPWLILVPKINNVRELVDLSQENQLILMEEIAYVSCIVKKIFHPDKLNIAALGNMVEQLHIHIIARFKDDIAWPNAPFNQEVGPYSVERFEDVISMLKQAF